MDFCGARKGAEQLRICLTLVKDSGTDMMRMVTLLGISQDQVGEGT